MSDNWSKAKELAARNYQVQIVPDETTDGEPGYFVRIPEMPGCVSDGSTIEEAFHNLESAKCDYIHFLLDHGLAVPEPQLLDSNVCVDLSDYGHILSGVQHTRDETVPRAIIASA